LFQLPLFPTTIPSLKIDKNGGFVNEGWRELHEREREREREREEEISEFFSSSFVYFTSTNQWFLSVVKEVAIFGEEESS
jgi:hypothetical protein